MRVELTWAEVQVGDTLVGSPTSTWGDSYKVVAKPKKDYLSLVHATDPTRAAHPNYDMYGTMLFERLPNEWGEVAP